MNSGAFILDKPEGFTSFDAIAVLRGLFKTKKIGHTGTLDPMATGVLVVLIGSATKALPFLEDTDKCYVAGFALGAETDTQDSTGRILAESSQPVSEQALRHALTYFQGDVLQVPPMYSAVSVGGQRLYTLARQGIEVERPPRLIHIDQLRLLAYDAKARRGSLQVSCSKGTYIRTLCADIGKKAGSFGMMTSLRRTSACGFTLKDAYTLEQARQMVETDSLWQALRPVETLFSHLGQVRVSAAQEKRFQNGGALDLNRLSLKRKLKQGEQLRVYGPSGFLGLGQGTLTLQEEQLKVLRLFRGE